MQRPPDPRGATTHPRGACRSGARRRGAGDRTYGRRYRRPTEVGWTTSRRRRRRDAGRPEDARGLRHDLAPGAPPEGWPRRPDRPTTATSGATSSRRSAPADAPGPDLRRANDGRHGPRRPVPDHGSRRSHDPPHDPPPRRARRPRRPQCRRSRATAPDRASRARGPHGRRDAPPPRRHGRRRLAPIYALAPMTGMRPGEISPKLLEVLADLGPVPAADDARTRVAVSGSLTTIAPRARPSAPT